MKCIQLCINRINTIISQCEFAGRKIIISDIVSEEFIDKYISNMREVLLFIQENVCTCSSQNIFYYTEAKIFLDHYLRIGQYKWKYFVF